MRWLTPLVSVFLLASLGGVMPASALDTAPTQPVLPPSSLMITAYQASADGLDLVQVYNDSSEVLQLDGMALWYSQADGASVEAVALSGYMRPYAHAVVAAVDVLVSSEGIAFRFVPTGATPKALWVSVDGYASVTIPGDVKADGKAYKRGRTTTGYSTSASALNTPLVGSVLEADALYRPPEPPRFEIIEVLTRARDCSPFDQDVRCGDYIKLRVLPGYVEGGEIGYRLRTGGEPSVSNTFSLLNSSRHGEYILQRIRDDGARISLSNGGGYVWLEDVYGLQKYEDTLVQYADAGSEKFIDQSWALNDQMGKWQWALPSPLGANEFPQVVERALVSSAVTTCPAGKYRNPETNRCRSIEDAVSELAACDEGKERNPVTNRCRSVVSTAAITLTPCDADQERNPATNRCRSVLAASQSLTPCKEGYERNPATNRCRKSSVVASAADMVADQAAIQKGGGSLLTSALLVTAGIGAVGYGVYEWRSEIWRGSRRLAQLVLRK